jgi:hypothetical protein
LTVVRTDIARTVLVVAEQPFLWGAVRGAVPADLAVVRRVPPDRLEDVWRRLSPWPWLVVGASSPIPNVLCELVADLPVPVLWLGRPDGPTPRTLIRFESWAGAAAHLEATENGRAGVAFRAARGVHGVTDCYSRPVAALEGLMAASDQGLPGFRHLHEVERLIADCRLPCRISHRDGRSHLVRRETADLSGDRRESACP